MTNMQRPRGIAASCWADDRTRGTVMDPVLAEVFAERLEALVSADDALYMAGRWTLSAPGVAPQAQAKLWEDLRACLGFKPGHSTKAGVNPLPSANI